MKKDRRNVEKLTELVYFKNNDINTKAFIEEQLKGSFLLEHIQPETYFAQKKINSISKEAVNEDIRFKDESNLSMPDDYFLAVVLSN